MFIDTGSLKDLAPLGAKHRKVLVDQPKHCAPTERLSIRALSGYKHLTLTGRSHMCNLLHFHVEFANSKCQMTKKNDPVATARGSETAGRAFLCENLCVL